MIKGSTIELRKDHLAVVAAKNSIEYNIMDEPTLFVYSKRVKKEIDQMYNLLAQFGVDGIKFCIYDETQKLERCICYSNHETKSEEWYSFKTKEGLVKLAMVVNEKAILDFNKVNDYGTFNATTSDELLIHLDEIKQELEPNLPTSSESVSMEVEQIIPIEYNIDETVKAILKNLLLFIYAKSPREAAGLQDDENINERMLIVLAIDYILKIAIKYEWALVRYQNSFYIYTGTYWQKIIEDELKEFLGSSAERIGINPYTARFYGFRENLIKQFRSAAYFTPPSIDTTATKINLQNGVYVITPTSRYLKPHDKEDFMTYKLTFPYDPSAKKEKFEKFLNRVLPDKAKQMVLAEFMAYVFIRNTVLKLEKGLILYGAGANGKSVIFQIILKLFGPENVSNYTLQSLTDSNGYTRALLAGKLLNYASELSSKMNPTFFKMLMSGEPIECRQIYERPFLLEDYCKFVFNTNILPRDIEQNDGFFRRFLIIHFDQKIGEEEQNPALAAEIIEDELPGVFNWVLDGLDRLLSQRGFTPCPAIDAIVNEYRKNSDSVALFLEDGGYAPSEDDHKSLKELFTSYKDFCKNGNYTACSERSFSERLRNHGYNVTRRSAGRIVGIRKTFQY